MKPVIVKKPSEGEILTPENPTLYRLFSIFPLDLFPDEVVVQKETVSLIRHFFLYSDMVTIPIKEIGRTELVESWFFASIQIWGKVPSHEIVIGKLWKSEARQAKQYIDDLMLGSNNSAEYLANLHEKVPNSQSTTHSSSFHVPAT